MLLIKLKLADLALPNLKSCSCCDHHIHNWYAGRPKKSVAQKLSAILIILEIERRPQSLGRAGLILFQSFRDDHCKQFRAQRALRIANSVNTGPKKETRNLTQPRFELGTFAFLCKDHMNN